MVSPRALGLFALLTSVALADEPDGRPAESGQTLPRRHYHLPDDLHQHVFEVSAQTAVSTVYAKSSPVVDENARMLKENPTLVRQLLLLLAEDEDEEVLTTIYCLGPAVAHPLLVEIDGDNPAVRDAALSALTCVCAHEDAPRTEIVRAILAQVDEADEERAATLRQVLQFVVRSMRPETRATLRAAFDHGLAGDH